MRNGSHNYDLGFSDQVNNLVVALYTIYSQTIKIPKNSPHKFPKEGFMRDWGSGSSEGVA